MRMMLIHDGSASGRQRGVLAPCAGFGLIESIITLLIVSFGLLALAYMQSWGQRYGQDAGSRTQATMIANELIDRIRVTGVPAAGAAAAGYTANPSDANNVTCDPAAVSAANDRDCFFFQIGERLPAAAGAIAINGNMYEITIAWLDRYADQFDTNDNGLTATECTSNGRLWYQDGSITWYPANRKPTQATCLLSQNWSLMQ